jgi:steroid 5-alpha reductase family enzyme
VTSFALHPFLTGLALAFGVSLAVFVLSWLVALRIGRFNVVDVVWGLSFVAVAVTSFAWSAGHSTDEWRRVLVLVLVAIWGARLSVYIGSRSRGKGEDPRYDAMLGDAPNRAVRALGIVFLLQAVVAWFISLPVQAAMYVRSGWSFLAVVGAAVWLVGLFFETVGDAQLSAFRNDPANKGKVMDIGLWRYTRHPNYFGDACVWWGIFLVAADAWPGVLTVLAPAVMTLLLTKGSGARILEKHMSKRDGWDDYAARTSMFIPRPPRATQG